MLRDLLIERGIGEKGGFRWRSHEVSRIEGLSDAVFGFAITLLVVSLDVPRDFTELANRMRGFLAFAISFAMLVWIWFEQHKYFRRYGLQDVPTVTLNVILLFVVLFYVYPLKFLFGLLVNLYSGQAVGVKTPDGGFAIGLRDITGEIDPILRADQWPQLMSVYAIGFIAIWLVFVLLTLHAYRLRDVLDLNALEVYDTSTKIREYLILMGFGVVSLALALSGGWRVPMSGWIYALIGPALGLHGYITGSRRARLARLFEEPRGPESGVRSQGVSGAG
jgi:transmembrane protein TMEM174 (potassium channel)